MAGMCDIEYLSWQRGTCHPEGGIPNHHETASAGSAVEKLHHPSCQGLEIDEVVGSPQGKKSKRYSPRFQFQVVLEVLKEDRDALEIARVHDLPPTTVARWKREFLENGLASVGKDTTLAAYEKKIREIERLLGRKEVEIASSRMPWTAARESREGLDRGRNADTYGLNTTLNAIGLPKST